MGFKRLRDAACLAVALALCGSVAAAQPPAGIPIEALIASARADIAGPLRNLWSGWDRAPFGLLLVEGDQERLLCDDRSPTGFGPTSPDPVTGCPQRSRARSFPPGLLAAMPAFGPPSVIVVGTPAATHHDPAEWRRVLFHEHFHQYQAIQPGYWDRVVALNLSRGDQTGMWMLNYAFPYADAVAQARVAEAGRVLAQVLAHGRPTTADLRRYLAARAAVQAAVSPDDFRYLDFQLWQEGVARWTEFSAGELSSDASVRAAGASLRRDTLAQLAALDLGRDQRVSVYALGAGEALLLDACAPGWRDRYLREVTLSPLWEAADGRCRRS